MRTRLRHAIATQPAIKISNICQAGVSLLHQQHHFRDRIATTSTCKAPVFSFLCMRSLYACQSYLMHMSLRDPSPESPAIAISCNVTQVAYNPYTPHLNVNGPPH